LFHTSSSVFFLFFTASSPTEIYTLSLHDALPISKLALDAPVMRQVQFSPFGVVKSRILCVINIAQVESPVLGKVYTFPRLVILRSEEHTSELQSRENLVCRLLLEKKKKNNIKKQK